MGILGNLESGANNFLDNIFGSKKPQMKITPLAEGVNMQDEAIQAKSEEAAFYQAQYLKSKQELERYRQAGEVQTVSDLIEELKKDAKNRRTISEKQRTVSYKEIWAYISNGNIVAHSKEGLPLGILKDVKKIYDEESGKTYHEAIWLDSDGHKNKAVAGSEEALFHNYEQLPMHLQSGLVYLNVMVTRGGVLVPDYFKMEKLTMKKKDLDQIVYDMQVQLGKERDINQELKFRCEKSEKRAENQDMQIITLKKYLEEQKISIQDMQNAYIEHSELRNVETKENIRLRETKDQLEEQLLAEKEANDGMRVEVKNLKSKTEMTQALSTLRTVNDLGKDMARRVVIKEEPEEKPKRIEIEPPQETQQPPEQV